MANITTKILFIAFPLPLEVKAELGRTVEALRHFRRVRWLDPERMHMTLWFLGDIDTESIGPLSGLLAGDCSPGEEYDFRAFSVGVFPDPVRPRVVVVKCEQTGSDTAAALHDRIGRLLEGRGYSLPGRRRWTPHITIGRIEASAACLMPDVPFHAFTFRLREYCLFESILAPSGAIHEPIACYGK